MTQNIMTPIALAEMLAAHFREPLTDAPLLIDIGCGCALASRMSDFHSVLLGIVKTEDGGRFPLLDQHIFGIKGNPLARVQTEEQACAALAENATGFAKRFLSGEITKIRP